MAKPSDRTGERGTGERGTGERASEARRAQIERNLKRVYDETLEEPLPDELAALLERLKQQGRK